MNNNMKNRENNKKPVFGTRLKYAFVCMATLDDINKINEYIARQPGIKPIYQKISVKSLRILEGEA